MNTDEKKKLPMRITFKELASLMDVCYATLRIEIKRNENLLATLNNMGWRSYQRLRKPHVVEIFKVMGTPDGYEHYLEQ